MTSSELLKLELENRRRLTEAVGALPFSFSGSTRGVIKAARLLAESEAAYRRYSAIDTADLVQAFSAGKARPGAEDLAREFRSAGAAWRKLDTAALGALEAIYLTPRSRRRLLHRLRRMGYSPVIHGHVSLDDWGIQ